MASWPRQLGEQHGKRDRAAGTEVQERLDAEQQQCDALLERWPAIVGAVKSVIDGYNGGTGVQAVVMLEDPKLSSVTLESTTNGRRTIVIALDGSYIAVRTRAGVDDPLSGPHWVSLERTNEHTAEYLLRDWLERL
jgi:hypothetical protein